MKIDVTQIINDRKGKPVQIMDAKGVPIEVEAGGGPLTLRYAACQALENVIPGDGENMKGPQKMRHFILAERIEQNDIVDLSAKDITVLTDRIGRAWGTVVAGRALMMLDPDLREDVASAAPEPKA